VVVGARGAVVAGAVVAGTVATVGGTVFGVVGGATDDGADVGAAVGAGTIGLGEVGAAGEVGVSTTAPGPGCGCTRMIAALPARLAELVEGCPTGTTIGPFVNAAVAPTSSVAAVVSCGSAGPARLS
jgi:hypothetical protein